VNTAGQLRRLTVESGGRQVVLTLAAALGVGLISLLAGPEAIILSVALTGMAMVVAVRPQWGVALILLMLMVQYGQRRYEREGVAGGLAALLPAGSGLLTINNLLGLFLALLLVYHLYRDGDWSFLRSRILQLVLLVTAVLVFSGMVSSIDVQDQAAVGLSTTSAQSPLRQLVSRALFMVLLVFFVQKPRDLRLIVGLFVALALVTAWSGSSAALTGAGQIDAGDYRAGGLDVLIQSTKNPNRLAMIATLGLVFIWEYSQAHRAQGWLRWLAMASMLLMIVTVFLTASRGGLIGLLVTGMLLFVRRRASASRVLYGLAIAAVGLMLVQEVVPEQALERITNIPGLSQTPDEVSGAGAGSAERRQYTYAIGFEIWKQAPVVGVGPGNWPYVRFMTDPLRSAAVAHNSYLAALAEGGLTTFVLYLVLFYVALRDLGRCQRSKAIAQRARAEGLEWLIAATRISLMAFLVFSLFSDLWDLVFAYLLLGIAAILVRRYHAADMAPVAA